MTFNTVYDTLYQSYGPQSWWPAESPFEVMVGAVLTQNTSWGNVEKAIENLKNAGSLNPSAIVNAAPEQLAAWLKPSGYFNIKVRRLRNFCTWYLLRGRLEGLASFATAVLREDLLSVNGIGPETADDILLYAFERPVFVIDAYTRRLFSRLGFIRGDEPYETVRALFESTLAGKAQGCAALFNEYHALIVHHGKSICRTRPLCAQCCLASHCRTALERP
ncbi:MAG: endonuclease III domain-containing protein [Gammaproteobacteria bacterium]